MSGSQLRSISILLALASLLLAAPGCGSNGSGKSSGSQQFPALAGAGETNAEIRGTVVDALTGAPVSGATISGPGGARGTSDEHGRFHLTGLPVGAEGEVVARTKNGGEARNPRRPLRSGVLEVVLRLRKS
jgi:hypothetical protein